MAAQVNKSTKIITSKGTFYYSAPTRDPPNICEEHCHQNNHLCSKLAQLVKNKGLYYEICPEKLYLVYLAKRSSAKEFRDQAENAHNSPFIIWTIFNEPTLNYEAFNMDFGPFNLANTHLFCSKLKVWFDTRPYRDHDKCVVVVLDEIDVKTKLNATLLVAIAAMVLLNMSDQEVIARLKNPLIKKSQTDMNSLFSDQIDNFSDVSGNSSSMKVTLDDCIHAFYAALQHKFYEYYEFDHAEYLFYETVMSGDLNWIVPKKVLAFAGPCDDIFNPTKQSHKHPPEFYHDYFKDHNVTAIVRLNEAEYEKSGFEKYGFKHHDLIFPDGYPPTSPIAEKFIKIVDEAEGAVAVHCYAGIGRTGTLIAAYLVARYNFTPQMAVAWTRICRPGSVIGDQQDWLLNKFSVSSISKPKPKSKVGKNRKTDCPPEVVNNSRTNYEVAEQKLGQAKALVLAKQHREAETRPCTRNSSQKRDSMEIAGNKSAQPTKKVELVVDLGKTIPFCLSHAEIKNVPEGQNPEFYRIREDGYEWNVKFPKPDYVTLRHDPGADWNSPEDDYPGELGLRFKYEHETTDGKHGLKDKPKMKPVVYYFFTWSDTYDFAH